MRGDLYRLRAAKGAAGHEQGGERYAVVLQSDDLLLSTWVIAPTSTRRRPTSFRPEVEIDGASARVLLEQLAVVDPRARLGDFAGRLSGAELADVDRALRVVLALD